MKERLKKKLVFVLVKVPAAALWNSSAVKTMTGLDSSEPKCLEF